MYKLAFVPLTSKQYDDKLFTDNNIKSILESNGNIVHTVDYYEELSDVDYFIFVYFAYKWYKKIYKKGLANRCIYLALEPPVVEARHKPENFSKLLKYFKYVLSWNNETIDNRRIYKFYVAYSNFKKEWGTIDFEKKKLICNISGNKKSKVKGELYTERRKVISYYNNLNDGSFGLYGRGWEKNNLNCYLGAPESKKEVYHKYRFALCLENICNIEDGITEKIFDCFKYGIVPIYYGISNVLKYIPQDCFIPYDKFNSVEELDKFIRIIGKNEYNKYLDAIDNFIKNGGIYPFSEENEAKILEKIFEMDKKKQFVFNGPKTLLLLKIDRIKRGIALIVRGVKPSYIIKRIFNKGY